MNGTTNMMGDQGQLVMSEQTIVLDLPPSCIEFCLTDATYFVVGTYNLQKDEQASGDKDSQDCQDGEEQQEVAKKFQNRNGSLMVFNIVEGVIEQVQVVPQPSAILDLHFCPVEGNENILAVASSTGTLAIFKLDPKHTKSSPLEHLATSTLSNMEDDVLFLSLAWHPSDSHVIAVTLSTGEVRLLYLNDTWEINQTEDDAIITHSLEAWTVSFSAIDAQTDGQADQMKLTIYSGGDDSALKYGSLGPVEADGTKSTLQTLFPPVTLREHGAGVTAILPTACRLNDGSSIVVTGSYDDSIRVFAVHSPQDLFGARKYTLLAEQNLGGGVWRLKLIVLQQDEGWWRAVILASCMHAGARIVEIRGQMDGRDWAIRVLTRFEEHKSMNYGSDFLSPSSDVLTCVSTSFYDKLLCLWDAHIA